VPRFSRRSRVPPLRFTNFEIESVGYGAGTKDFADRPNLLRLMIGRERNDLRDRRLARNLR